MLFTIFQKCHIFASAAVAVRI